MVATAGGLVFCGTVDGWFKAVDARSGRLLCSERRPSGLISQPVIYRGPDGRQYVAVLARVGGWSGAIVSLGLDPGDLSAGERVASLSLSLSIAATSLSVLPSTFSANV